MRVVVKTRFGGIDLTAQGVVLYWDIWGCDGKVPGLIDGLINGLSECLCRNCLGVRDRGHTLLRSRAVSLMLVPGFSKTAVGAGVKGKPHH